MLGKDLCSDNFFQLIGNFLYGHHIRLLRISCIASAGYDKKILSPVGV